MSTPKKTDQPDLARGWLFVEKLLAEDPGKLDVATDEEVERQMEEQGVHADGAPDAEEMLAYVAERAAKRQAAKR